MKKKTKPIFNGAEALASLVFLCAQSAALMYVLCRSYAFLCTVIMTAVSFGIYMVFYKLRRRKGFSFLAFVVLFIIVNTVCNIVGNPYRSPSFLEFIFTSSDFFDPSYAAAAILLFSMMIGFSVCYFTAYLPRPGLLLMPAYIPFILAARTLGSLPLGLLIFLAVGFFVAAMGIARPETPQEIVYYDDKHSRRERLSAAGIIALAAAVVLIILPRNENTVFMNYLDTVLRERTSYYGRQTLSNFMQSSIPNRGNNNPSSDTLFLAQTYFPRNVSRWSFDIYQGADGWTYDEGYSRGYSDWERSRKAYSVSELVKQLKAAVNDGKLARYKDEINRLEDIESVTAQMTIRITDGSSTGVVLHPNNTVGARITGVSDKTYRNDKDEIFTAKEMGRNASYVLEYYAEDPDPSLAELFERVGFQEMLNEAFREDAIDFSLYDAFSEESQLARDYFKDTNDSTITSEIKALADEITAGITNDYEKAHAIEQWFGEAGYVYDMDFVPETPTAEYFLFDSKRGICTDFATASTLLLRAAGIPARYTEGFVLDEESRDVNGRYVVTAAQAHAYSTAYIEGCGWIEIDGTKYARVDNTEELLRNSLIIIISIGAVLLIAGIIFRRQLSELAFAVVFRFSEKNAAIRRVYLRTRNLVCKIPGIDPKSATAEEVRDIAARTLGMDAEAGEITDAANELFYGSGTPDADEKRLYENYKAIYKMKRSRGK
ncbi:MAG: transglutaminase domain-containing protein [Oscillospiraceae bacterium]|nr:transglutaminase domain-containing protein [Oscillospiraceae bacterium]